MCTYVRVVCGACMRVLVCVCVARRELLHRKSFSSLASLSRTKQKGSVWNGSLVPPRQQSWNMNTMCDPLEDVSCLQQALSRLVRGHAHMASVCLFNPWEWCKEWDDVFCGFGCPLCVASSCASSPRVRGRVRSGCVCVSCVCVFVSTSVRARLWLPPALLHKDTSLVRISTNTLSPRLKRVSNKKGTPVSCVCVFCFCGSSLLLLALCAIQR